MPTARRVGIDRFVLVQPSAYGSDNTCLLDTLRAIGSDQCRGVVVAGEQLPADDVLARWHDAGVRGLRIFGFPPGHAHLASSEATRTPGLASALRPRIEQLESLARRLGWHLDFLFPGSLTVELLPTLRRLTVDFTLAHLGMCSAGKGIDQPGFVHLLRLLRETDRCWVKVTAPYRISSAPSFDDVQPMVEAVIEAAPDRVVWGSDHPHLMFEGQAVGPERMLTLVRRWIPALNAQRRVLVTNPAALFGFDAPAHRQGPSNVDR